jgi:dipeptidyl-peptidase-4
MKIILTGALISVLACGTISAQDGNKKVTLKEITDGYFRQMTSTGEMRSTPDGEYYTAMNRDRDMIIKYSYKTGQPVDTLFNANKARECTFKKIDGYEINSTGKQILVWNNVEYIYRRSFKANFYQYDVRRNYVSPLTTDNQKIMIPNFSPNGRMCAFVKDNNIWIRKFDYDSEIQITKDGEINKILNGVTDWVYEEEFSVTDMITWSSDSQILAYLRTDESEVPVFSMQMYGDNDGYPSYYNFKYPKAGQVNSQVSVFAYNIDSRETQQLDVPLDKDGYIPRIEFTTVPNQLAVMTLNRNQNVMNMYFVNAKSNVSKLILSDKNKAYVDSEWLSSIKFYPSGFTYVSEQDGYSHLYFYSPTGTLIKQVTKGNWDVTDFLGYDEANKTFYYQSAEESPIRRAVYKIDGKGVKTKLTKGEGTNSASFSNNFAYYVNHYSNASTPTRITVNETKTGKELRVLQDNEALKNKLAQYSYSPKEFITVTTTSGVELNGWIVKPKDFNPNKKYPMLMFQYSGPNSQSVQDQFGFDWEQYLANNGIISVCVDGRGTGARGEEFRKCTYLKMGVLESKDQAEAAQALGKLPYIDENNMAIWGWSFGGYNTLMSLSTGNGTFKVGIAVAPPTDWKYYDTVYTERFMRTPQENPEGYAITSPLKLADKLQGKLLLIHGTADDNVHFQQTMDYAEALVQAGKQFDMQIYKDRNHSIYGGNTRNHLYTRMSNFLFENLK